MGNSKSLRVKEEMIVLGVRKFTQTQLQKFVLLLELFIYIYLQEIRASFTSFRQTFK